MGPSEKKIAVVLVVILIAMLAVYASTGKKPQAGPMMAEGEGAECATGAPSGSGAAAKTEELGRAGAKVEIIAVVPVAKGCHAATVAELKKAYQAHPQDIHLIIVDLQGPDAPKYREKVGSPYTIVKINGKHQFEVGGRRVSLERMEGASYRPSDIGPIIEAELRR